MTRLTLASLVLTISILPLYAQSSSLHTDRSGYTTGTDGNRTVNTYTDQYGNTTGSIGGKYISTYSDGYGGTRGTIGNKSINTYQDGYGNTTGTIGRDRVQYPDRPFGPYYRHNRRATPELLYPFSNHHLLLRTDAAHHAPDRFGLSRLCGAGNGQGSGHDRDHEQLAVRPHLAASSSRSQHWPASHQHQAGHDHRIISLGSRPIRAMLTILANAPSLTA